MTRKGKQIERSPGLIDKMTTPQVFDAEPQVMQELLSSNGGIDYNLRQVNYALDCLHANLCVV